MTSTAAVKELLTDTEARVAKARAEKEYWRWARVHATVRAQTFAGHCAPIKGNKESARVTADEEVDQVTSSRR